MRVIICGSRGYTNCYVDLVLECNDLGVETIVHGACPNSADEVADQMEYEGFKIERFPADWSKGKGAGFLRNCEMAEAGADLCIAVWDGKSKGTLNMIQQCVFHRIPVKILPAK